MNLPYVSSLKVYDAISYLWGTAQEVQDGSGSADIWPFVSRWRFTDKLSEPNTLTFDVVPGCEWHIEDLLHQRQRIRVFLESDYGKVPERVYRIQEVQKRMGEGGGLTVIAWELDSDLAASVFRYVNNPDTTVKYGKHFSNMTVDEVLDVIFDPAYGLVSSSFIKNSVEASIASLKVSFYANNTNHLAMLRQLAEALRFQHRKNLEWQVTFVDTAGELDFDFFEEIGLTDTERGSGVDAAKRLIEDENRTFARYEDNSEQYYSAIIPFGGREDQLLDIGQAKWVPDSIFHISGQTVIVFEDDPIFYDNMFATAGSRGAYVEDDGGTTYAIESSSATNTIVVTGNATGAAWFRFVASEGMSKNGIGSDMTYLHDPAAENLRGVVEKTVVFPEIPPFVNLFVDAGGSGDMSDWSAGAPLGIEALVGTTLSEVTTELHVEHGTSSMKVEGDSGSGVRTLEIDLQPTDLSPYFSALALIRVEAGRVRFYMEDSVGVRYPDVSLEQFDGVSTESMKIAWGGEKPASGLARLYLEAQEDGTIFYVDALNLTQSVGYQEYAASMGPNALWLAAGNMLLETGGIRPASFETRVIDLWELDTANRYPYEVGSYVQYRGLKNESETYAIDVIGRIETKEYGGPGQGGIGTPERRIVVAHAEPTFEEKFIGGYVRVDDDGMRLPVPTRKRVPRIRVAGADDFTLKPYEDNVNNLGYVDVSWPERIASTVLNIRARGYVGQPIPEADIDNWDDPDVSGSADYFEVFPTPTSPLTIPAAGLPIDPDNGSYLQVQVELTDSSRITFSPIFYDMGTEANVHVIDPQVQGFDVATGEVRLLIHMEGDSDTTDIKYELSETFYADPDNEIAWNLAAALGARVGDVNHTQPLESVWYIYAAGYNGLTKGPASTLKLGPFSRPRRPEWGTLDVTETATSWSVIFSLTDPDNQAGTVESRVSPNIGEAPTGPWTDEGALSGLVLGSKDMTHGNVLELRWTPSGTSWYEQQEPWSIIFDPDTLPNAVATVKTTIQDPSDGTHDTTLIVRADGDTNETAAVAQATEPADWDLVTFAAHDFALPEITVGDLTSGSHTLWFNAKNAAGEYMTEAQEIPLLILNDKLTVGYNITSWAKTTVSLASPVGGTIPINANAIAPKAKAYKNTRGLLVSVANPYDTIDFTLPADVDEGDTSFDITTLVGFSMAQGAWLRIEGWGVKRPTRPEWGTLTINETATSWSVIFSLNDPDDQAGTVESRVSASAGAAPAGAWTDEGALFGLVIGTKDMTHGTVLELRWVPSTGSWYQQQEPWSIIFDPDTLPNATALVTRTVIDETDGLYDSTLTVRADGDTDETAAVRQATEPADWDLVTFAAHDFALPEITISDIEVGEHTIWFNAKNAAGEYMAEAQEIPLKILGGERSLDLDDKAWAKTNSIYVSAGSLPGETTFSANAIATRSLVYAGTKAVLMSVANQADTRNITIVNETEEGDNAFTIYVEGGTTLNMTQGAWILIMGWGAPEPTSRRSVLTGISKTNYASTNDAIDETFGSPFTFNANDQVARAEAKAGTKGILVSKTDGKALVNCYLVDTVEQGATSFDIQLRSGQSADMPDGAHLKVEGWGLAVATREFIKDRTLGISSAGLQIGRDSRTISTATAFVFDEGLTHPLPKGTTLHAISIAEEDNDREIFGPFTTLNREPVGETTVHVTPNFVASPYAREGVIVYRSSQEITDHVATKVPGGFTRGQIDAVGNVTRGMIYQSAMNQHPIDERMITDSGPGDSNGDPFDQEMYVNSKIEAGNYAWVRTGLRQYTGGPLPYEIIGGELCDLLDNYTELTIVAACKRISTSYNTPIVIRFVGGASIRFLFHQDTTNRTYMQKVGGTTSNVLTAVGGSPANSWIVAVGTINRTTDKMNLTVYTEDGNEWQATEANLTDDGDFAVVDQIEFGRSYQESIYGFYQIHNVALDLDERNQVAYYVVQQLNQKGANFPEVQSVGRRLAETNKVTVEDHETRVLVIENTGVFETNVISAINNSGEGIEIIVGRLDGDVATLYNVIDHINTYDGAALIDISQMDPDVTPSSAILNRINISLEGIHISSDRVTVGADSDFDPEYDPTIRLSISDAKIGNRGGPVGKLSSAVSGSVTSLPIESIFDDETGTHFHLQDEEVVSVIHATTGTTVDARLSADEAAESTSIAVEDPVTGGALTINMPAGSTVSLKIARPDIQRVSLNLSLNGIDVEAPIFKSTNWNGTYNVTTGEITSPGTVGWAVGGTGDADFTGTLTFAGGSGRIDEANGIQIVGAAGPTANRKVSFVSSLGGTEYAWAQGYQAVGTYSVFKVEARDAGTSTQGQVTLQGGDVWMELGRNDVGTEIFNLFDGAGSAVKHAALMNPVADQIYRAKSATEGEWTTVEQSMQDEGTQFFSLEADSGGATDIGYGESLDFAGGTNMSTSRSGNTITFNASGGGSGTMDSFFVLADTGGATEIGDGETVDFAGYTGIGTARAGNEIQIGLEINTLSEDSTPQPGDWLVMYDGAHEKVRIDRLQINLNTATPSPTADWVYGRDASDSLSKRFEIDKLLVGVTTVTPSSSDWVFGQDNSDSLTKRFAIGNLADEIPLSNGTMCVDLNAEMLGGLEKADYCYKYATDIVSWPANVVNPGGSGHQDNGNYMEIRDRNGQTHFVVVHEEAVP